MSEGLFDNPRLRKLTEKPWFLGAAFLAITFGGFIVFSAMYLFVRAVLYGADPAFRDIGILVLAIFGAPFVIWRSIVAQGNLDRSKDRDYADLFTKAVEQLGATREVREWDEETKRDIYRHEPNIEVRLGAIYALERISQDSERDHIAVMETLCAYVRENAPSSQAYRFPMSLLRDQIPRALRNNSDQENGWWRQFKSDLRTWLSSVPQPRADIQVVLTVLGRRKHQELKVTFDLRKANLQKANFKNSNFANARFAGAALDGAYFIDANLEFASFRAATMWGANLSHATLDSANLRGAHLDVAAAKGASLKNANLRMTRCRGANLRGVQAKNAVFRGALLNSVQLRGADCRAASFRGADLIASDLRGTDLNMANLSNADLQSANLRSANLRDADTKKANFLYAKDIPSVADIDSPRSRE